MADSMAKIDHFRSAHAAFHRLRIRGRRCLTTAPQRLKAVKAAECVPKRRKRQPEGRRLYRPERRIHLDWYFRSTAFSRGRHLDWYFRSTAFSRGRVRIFCASVRNCPRAANLSSTPNRARSRQSVRGIGLRSQEAILALQARKACAIKTAKLCAPSYLVIFVR